MRHFTITLVLFFSAFTLAYAQWNELKVPSNQSSTLYDGGGKYYLRLSSRNFYRAIHPFDWEPCAPLPPRTRTQEVQVSFDTIFFMAYDTATNLHQSIVSRDAGSSWQITGVLPFPLDSVTGTFKVNSRIFCAISGNQTYFSDNYGQSWALYQLPFFSSAMNARLRAHKNAIFYSDYQHNIFRSTDNGDTWTKIELDSLGGQDIGPELYACKNSLFAAEIINFEYKWFESVDLGQTWIPRPTFGDFSQIHSVQDKLFARTSPSWQYSEDNGATWAVMPNIESVVSERVISASLSLSVDAGATWINDWKSDFQNTYNYISTGNETVFLERVNFYANDTAALNWKYRPVLGTPYYIEARTDGLLVSTEGNTLKYSFNDGVNWQSTQLTKQVNCVAAVGNTIFLAEQIGIWSVQYYYTQDFGQTLIPFTSVSEPGSFFKTSERLYYLTGLSSQLYGAEFNDPLNFTQLGAGPALDHHRVFTAGKYLFAANQNTRSLSRYYNGVWESAGQFASAPFNITQVNATMAFGDEIYLRIDQTGPTGNYNIILLSTDGGLNWGDITSQFDPIQGTYLLDIEQTRHNLYVTALHRQTGHLRLFQKSVQSPLQFQVATGLVYLDENQNALRDNNEPALPNVALRTRQTSSFGLSDAQGAFSLLYLSGAPDSIQPIALKPYHFTTTALVPIDATLGVTHHIGITRVENITDLSLDITPINVFRPGFDSQIFVKVKNVGTVSVPSSELTIELDPLLILASSSVLQPTSVSNNVLTFTLPTMSVESEILIYLSVTLSQMAALNAFVEVNGHVQTPSTDANPLNNTSSVRDVILGSYDPNDKAVSPEFMHPDALRQGDSVIYTIRFQNTGTYKADFVRIIDTISAHLYPESIQFISASHPFVWSLKNRNVLDILFAGIDLPDSTSNEPASHGFIKFSIKPDSTLLLGDIISNTAEIYFDFNLPIVTNTVQSEIKIIVPTHQPENPQSLDFLVMPNPARDMCYLRFAKPVTEPCTVEIQDISGKVISTTRHVQLPQISQLNELPKHSGIYYLTVKTKTGSGSQKFIVLE